MAKVCPNCELTYSDDDFFCAVDGSPLRSTGVDADNLVGTVIADRYRVEAILGEGGMGRVYRARHVRVPREAAIKVLRRALVADSYAVAAFNREARNAASVGDHPNVAAVYDFGETSDGLVFLAMEYIEGETLARRLEREPVLPPHRAVEIVRQIAAGLTAAHELPEPVVHRDLKPDNILLKATRDGSDWVKIVDFGIAKAAKRDTQLLTTPGLVVGTPRYMSPEQLTGSTIDVRADVYALAIIAYRLLTGSMPFASAGPDDESTIQWALQRLTQPPLPLERVSPGVERPSGVQAVFDRALQRDPNQRTPSAAEFARDLARAFGYRASSGVMGGVPDGARDASVAASPNAPTIPLPVPDHDARTKPISVTAEESPREPRAPAETNGRSRRALPMIGAAVALVVAVAALLVWARRPADVGAAAAVALRDTAGRIADASQTTAPSRPKTAVERPRTPGETKATDPRPTSTVPPTLASDSGVPPNAIAEPVRRRDTATVRGVDESAVRSRATLDELKAAVADPDAVAATGNGATLLDRIDRLLPALASRADSVEAMYYAVEINLILDKPAVACRLLDRLRTASRGTPYQVSVGRYLADTALACARRD